MKRKYVRPMSAVFACDMENTLMTGSNTGTIPVGGIGTKPRYAPEHDDVNSGSIFSHSGVFDEVDSNDFDDMGESTGKVASSDIW